MTRQEAINAMCKQCIYDPMAGLGTWRQQTDACPSTGCPLWAYRPRTSAGREPTGRPQPEWLRRAATAPRARGSGGR